VDAEGARTSPRRPLRRAREAARVGAAAALAVALRLSGKQVGAALVYHRVADRAGDARFELNPAVAARAFDRQLRFLARFFQLVDASALPTVVAARKRGRRLPIAVTFDDDLPEHRGVTAPLLRAQGVRATFFLCGSFFEPASFFWWEDLQTAVDAGTLRPDDVPSLPRDAVADAVASRPRAIHRLAQAIEAMEPDERAATARLLAGVAEPHRAGADRLREEEARELAESFELGFHTRRHDVLTTLDDAGLARSLTEGRAQLEQLVGSPLRVIAYPHGKADGRVVAAVREAAFDVGYTGAHEVFTSGQDPLSIGRLEPRSGDTLGRFAWSLARLLLQA